MYDHSLRVPAIVRWPQVVAKGATIHHTATSLDFFPTIVAMAHAELPTSQPVRGRSLLPLLRGQPPVDWNQDLYAHYHMINYAEADMQCYRTPRFKLIRDVHNRDRDEFYDLLADPGETSNLIASRRPEVLAAIGQLQATFEHQAELLRPITQKEQR